MQDGWQFCICIVEGGHFSIPDADADPIMIGLALNIDLKKDAYLESKLLASLNQSPCPMYEAIHMMRTPTFVA